MRVSSPIQFGRNLSLAPTGVVPIPKGELRVINTDPHNQKEKYLVPILTPRGETMWVHPDIVQSRQWMNITNGKSKGKAKAFSSNVVGIFIRETEEDVASLTSSGEEESVFATNTGASLTSKTRSDRPYLKQYGEPIVDSPQPAEEAIKQSTRPSVEKQKELWLLKLFRKAVRDHQHPFIWMSWLN